MLVGLGLAWSGRAQLVKPPTATGEDFWNRVSGTGRAALEATASLDVMFFGYAENALVGGQYVFLRDNRTAAVIAPATCVFLKLWCICIPWYRGARLHTGAATPQQLDPAKEAQLVARKMVRTAQFLKREVDDPRNQTIGPVPKFIRACGKGLGIALIQFVFAAMRNTDSDVLKPDAEFFRQLFDPSKTDIAASVCMAVSMQVAVQLVAAERARGADPGREERLANLYIAVGTVMFAFVEILIRNTPISNMRARGLLEGTAAAFGVRKLGLVKAGVVAAGRRCCGIEPVELPAAALAHPNRVAAYVASRSRLSWLADGWLDMTAPIYVPAEMLRDIFAGLLAAAKPGSITPALPAQAFPQPRGAEALAAPRSQGQDALDAGHRPSEVALEVVEPPLRIHGMSQADIDALYAQLDVTTVSRPIAPAREPVEADEGEIPVVIE